MTNSTGNWPPPGRAGGRIGKVWMPGMAATRPVTSGRISKALRFRSSHGLRVDPQNPLSGVVSWKTKFDSGISLTVRYTSRVNGVS